MVAAAVLLNGSKEELGKASSPSTPGELHNSDQDVIECHSTLKVVGGRRRGEEETSTFLPPAARCSSAINK